MSSVEAGSERRENRLVLVIGILVAVVFALAVAQAVAARIMLDQRQLLNERTPVIAAIDRAEVHNRCMDQLVAVFLASAAEAIVAEESEQVRLIPEMMLAVERVRQAARPGADPCAVSGE